MNLTQLEYFYLAAKAGSFSLAAKNSYVAQPTLSEAVSALEKEWGLPLFERHRGGIALTDFGEAMLSQCEILLTMAGRVAGFAERYRNSLSSVFTLAYDTTCLSPEGNGLSAEKLLGLGESAGDVDCRLVGLSSDACLAAVERGTADIAIVVGEPDPAKYLFSWLCNIHFLVALPADSELASRDSIRIGDLADFVLFPRPDLGSVYQRIVSGYRRYGIEPRFAESPIAYTRENTQSFVGEGRGIDISPAHFANYSCENVVYRSLVEEDGIVLPAGLAEKLGNKVATGAKLKQAIMSLGISRWEE